MSALATRKRPALVPWTLGVYVARVTLANVLTVAVGFLVLAFVIDLVEQLRATAGRGVPLWTAVELAACHVPGLMERLWPFAVLFGAMLAFWRLNRASELVVVRAAGVSAWQFLLPAALAVAALGAFLVTTINPVAAALTARYERLEAQVLDGDAEVLMVFPNGIWLRQALGDGSAILNAQRVEAVEPLSLQNVVVFEYDAQGRFVARLDAPTAVLADGRWQLDGVLRSDGTVLEQAVGRVELPTRLDADSVRRSFRNPTTLSFWDLPGYIRILGELGFSAREHEVHWYALLATPAFFAAMLLTGVSVTLRFQRRGGLGLLVLLGLASGFAFFVLVDVVKALGVSGQLPTQLAAFAPSAVALLLGSAVLFQLEDG